MSTIRPYRASDAEHSDRAGGDRLRHRQKVRQSIRENITDIVSEESIIGKDRGKIIKVPIRGVKEYRFVYGDNGSGAASGDGNTASGQVVGKAKVKQGDGSDKAGDQPGEDYYETDITLDELIEIMFEDLQLPEMAKKRLKKVEALADTKRKGHRKKGIPVRRDNRKSLINKKKRVIKMGLRSSPRLIDETAFSALPESDRRHYIPAEGDPGWYRFRVPFHEDDLEYKHMVPDIREESNAVVICIMDTSGSMDMMKKYLARCFFFLLYQFVVTKYRSVELVFIAHHTEAKEVTEEEFFHKGESGGTFISSGYRKALEVISSRYDPELWNVYAFHCSDGDNFDLDNNAAMAAAQELAKICNLFGYGEIKPLGGNHYESSMIKLFGNKIDPAQCRTVLIEKKEDLWAAFKTFLGAEGGDL